MGDSVRPQQGFSYWFAHQTGGSNYHDAPLIRDGVPYNDPGYLTDVITDGGLEFLERQRADDRPFYLSVHYTAPHSPWVNQHPPEIVASYDDCPFRSCPDVPPHPWQIASAPRGTGEQRREILKGYFAAVTAMDGNVGRIVDWLEANDRREDTIIFFVSDNGMNMGHHGIFGKGNGTFPLNMYEESVKVPAILSAPGRCREGVVEAGLYSQCDFLPTLGEYLELPLPEPEKLPGESFAPILRGQGLPGREDVVACEEYGPVRMIRDRAWKYIHRYPYGPHELYHLAQDPGEEHNLVADPACKARVEAMKGRLDAFFVRYGDPARDGAREPVRGSGQLDRVGPAGEGRPAHFGALPYVDANGHPREEGYQPPGP
jgi:arylsulfatase A-like enzyme